MCVLSPTEMGGQLRIFGANDLGEALRAGRKARRLTQAEAAQLAGVSPRLWSELELGKRPQVGLETALRMAQTVNIDLYTSERGKSGAERLRSDGV